MPVNGGGITILRAFGLSRSDKKCMQDIVFPYPSVKTHSLINYREHGKLCRMCVNSHVLTMQMRYTPVCLPQTLIKCSECRTPLLVLWLLQWKETTLRQPLNVFIGCQFDTVWTTNWLDWHTRFTFPANRHIYDHSWLTILQWDHSDLLTNICLLCQGLSLRLHRVHSVLRLLNYETRCRLKSATQRH